MISVPNSGLCESHNPSRFTKFSPGIDLTVLMVVLTGCLSTLLFLYSDGLWRTSFRKNVPLLDNVMQARVSLAEAYLWLDELKKGNNEIRIEVILASYDQAARAVDACVKGKSVIKGLPGLPLKDEELRTQMAQFKNSIEQTRTIAAARWQHREDHNAARTMDRKLHTAYHGLELMAGAITSKLQKDISHAMKRQKTIHFVTLFLWLTIIVGVSIVLMSVSKRRKQSTERLQHYQLRLRGLASELVLTEERERRRLATDLHDTIAQNLAISKTKLDALGSHVSSSDLNTALDEVRELLKPAIRDARSLIFQLSPPILYIMGLEAAVESLAEQTREQHGLVTTVTDDNLPKPLSEDILVLLFRAVRELLINVIKHSQSHTAKISIKKDNGYVRIDVADDGIGFDSVENDLIAAEKTGFGLFSIRERLHHLGGHLEIHSHTGLGTRVTLVAPLQKDGKILRS